MWFKRPRPARPELEGSHRYALRPWGDAAYLSPHHLPLLVEGETAAIHAALTGFVAAAREAHIPVFLLEGSRPRLALVSGLGIPAQRVLPLIVPGTTHETIRQTLHEVNDHLNLREGAADHPWPALLLCRALGAQQASVLEVIQELNDAGGVQLGLVYVQYTRTPPLERPGFSAQLHCRADGRAQLRLHHGYHAFQLPSEPSALFTPWRERPSRQNSVF